MLVFLFAGRSDEQLHEALLASNAGALQTFASTSCLLTPSMSVSGCLSSEFHHIFIYNSW